jgi:hypothetical protein
MICVLLIGASWTATQLWGVPSVCDEPDGSPTGTAIAPFLVKHDYAIGNQAECEIWLWFFGAKRCAYTSNSYSALSRLVATIPRRRSGISQVITQGNVVDVSGPLIDGMEYFKAAKRKEDEGGTDALLAAANLYKDSLVKLRKADNVFDWLPPEIITGQASAEVKHLIRKATAGLERVNRLRTQNPKP